MADHVHDLFEILMMSLAIGMDAFSLSIGLGLNGPRRHEAISLAVWIGLFHVGMTMFGLSAGMMLGSALGHIAHWFGALLLIGLGVHMLYSTLFGGPELVAVRATVPSRLAFAAGVSVDALSVGFSLGLRSTAYGIISALSFGAVATLMCLAGMVIGKRATSWAGVYGELCGAIILIGYGFHFLFG